MLQGLPKKKFNRFIDRVKARKNALKEVPDELKPLISLTALKAVLDHVIENKRSFFTALEQDARVNQKHAYDVSIRIDKRYAAPIITRSCYIIYDQVLQDFYLILHTKRKDAEDKPREVTHFDGASKAGLETWRIDTSLPLPWLSLKIKDLSNLVNIQDEVKVVRDVYRKSVEKFKDKTPFLPVFMPKPHKTHVRGKSKLLLFTPKGPKSLYQTVIKENQIIPQIQWQTLAEQLLSAVEFLHSMGVIHQDLSLANILYENGRLYIIDFGSASTHQVQYFAVGPHYLDSPEVALYRIGQNKLREFDQSYGKYLCRNLYLRTPKQLRTKGLFRDPNPANDMWSVGMILATIMCETPVKVVNFPHLRKSALTTFHHSVQAHPFYSQLLAADRTQRLSATAALQQVQQEPQILQFMLLSSDWVDFPLERKTEDELDSFFVKIEETLNIINANEHDMQFHIMPAENLRQIYNYVLQNRHWLEYLLTTPTYDDDDDENCLGSFCRLDIHQTGLAFPIQIIRDSAMGFILLVDCMVAQKHCTFRMDCLPLEQVQQEKPPCGVLTAFESHRSQVQPAQRVTESAANKLVLKTANKP
ncbi:MAG: phosphotransferase [Proteobacteria bacterium]|nr:phosphotransferase [Pseudomonadota bacterium]